jgi:DNA-binding transcriptional MocR family regulator/CheY-like chemotaxis protein
VLIVDDDEAVRLALRLILDDHHDVLEAADGAVALELLEREPVDVVVLDLLLPGADGFEVLERVRGRPRPLGVVVISALGTSWPAAAAMRLGAVDYLTKPFDDAQVLTAVAEGLAASRRRAPPATPARRPRLLCVGLPLGVRATLTILLGDACLVESAPDVAAALEEVEADPPDAVAADRGQDLSVLRGRFLRGPVVAFVSIGALLRDLAAIAPRPADRWSTFGDTTRWVLDDLCDRYARAAVERLAATLRLAPHALADRFRREMGTPLRAYVQALRIEVARLLLLETGLGTSAIAAHVGLHDASHLSRLFTVQVGCRPGAYRRRARASRAPGPAPSGSGSSEEVPFVTPVIRIAGDRVAFDVAECTGELRPPRLFSASLGEALREADRARSFAPPRAFDDVIGHYLAERGVSTTDAVVLTTSGTSSSLAILARALASAGDVVAVEHPTSPAALAAFAGAGLRVLGIPVDDEGLRMDLLAAALRTQRVRLVHVQPAFQNPTGVSLSAARRLALRALARSSEAVVVEDDSTAELAYEDAPPPLRAGEGAQRIVYLKSFAKLLAPALRVAVIVTPRAHAETLRTAQHGVDPFPSPFAQAVAARCLPTPEFRQHLERIRGLLEARWQVLHGALQTRMPGGVRWTVPRGGMCTWLELPPPLTAVELSRDVAAAGVGVSPGPKFCLDGSGDRGTRLAFGATPPAMIERGIRELARVIRERLHEGSLHRTC